MDCTEDNELGWSHLVLWLKAGGLDPTDVRLAIKSDLPEAYAQAYACAYDKRTGKYLKKARLPRRSHG